MKDELKQIKLEVIKSALTDMATNGLTLKEAADKYKVSTRTIQRYLADHPELASTVKSERIIVDDTIDRAFAIRLKIIEELLDRLEGKSLTEIKTSDLLRYEKKFKEFLAEADRINKPKPGLQPVENPEPEEESDTPIEVSDEVSSAQQTGRFIASFQPKLIRHQDSSLNSK